jgi:hypothetical protein
MKRSWGIFSSFFCRRAEWRVVLSNPLSRAAHFASFSYFNIVGFDFQKICVNGAGALPAFCRIYYSEH